jgi:hypothetical protein
MQFSPEAY